MKRSPSDPIFGGLVPDDIALDYIQRWENGDWELVTTTPADDMAAIQLQESLERQYGKVIHYQHAARRDGQDVGINPYFIQKVPATS